MKVSSSSTNRETLAQTHTHRSDTRKQTKLTPPCPAYARNSSGSGFICLQRLMTHRVLQYQTAFTDKRLRVKRLYIWAIPLLISLSFFFAYGVFLRYNNWLPKRLWSVIFVAATLHVAYTLWCFAACVFSYTGVRPDVYDELRKLAPGTEDIAEACKMYASASSSLFLQHQRRVGVLREVPCTEATAGTSLQPVRAVRLEDGPPLRVSGEYFHSVLLPCSFRFG